VSWYQKGKTNLDFTEARDSEWHWHQLGHMQVCTSLQTDNQASNPPLSFLQAGCPSCRPTNSVKALKATTENNQRKIQLKQSKVKYKSRECVCFSMHIARFYLLFSAHGQLSVLCSLAVQLSMNCYCL